ncbi:neuroendocrine convertase 1-like [Neodiprion fabricii]|uniref:neuroendocrine convertase 1-like n=1 Tax=Neodiprion fabricii TaxID=2872261 RepID=UPI001ED8EBA0|nr:neuroendocrine convertase 1-like [Neodiprion fabricii]
MEMITFASLNAYICLTSLCLRLSAATPAESVGTSATPEEYENEWVVRVDGGPEIAALLALQSGYKHLGPVLGFEDTYLWHKDKSPQHQKRGGHPRLGKALNSHAKVIWADRQKVIRREKRDHVSLEDLESERPLVREKRLPLKAGEAELPVSGNHTQVKKSLESEKRSGRSASKISVRDAGRRRKKRSIQEIENSKMFNDELWGQEWYLQDTRSTKDLPKLDLNVLPLYRLGITGRGIRVAVLDDGLEYTHEDLQSNYDAAISYDVNEADADPIPRYESTGINGHGTRCAGEISMRANNGKCGVGVAFGASIGGIKLLDGVVNDRVEGEALGYRTDLVDIYTASWGPADDGRSLEAPGRLALEALHKGITQGRNGKGCIYVWASGNGGSRADDCGCDGYVGSIYTVAVGSASQTGRFPWYGERCPATLATTYSSGAYHDQMIATTDLRNTCTTRHTGTSASAPLAAGILALALQVNENLTWRDVQHLVVWTSEYVPLSENPGWFKNAAGFWFNPRFGFGLMNAYALVTTGYNWTTVPDKKECHVPADYVSNKTLTYGNPVHVTFDTDGCARDENEINYLEHVQVEVNIRYAIRGAVKMHLTSPSGTRVRILAPRTLDDSDEGFLNWRFMSVASWGEVPRGIWQLQISDSVGPQNNSGDIGNLTLILHGTKTIPDHARNGPRIYNDDYSRMRKTNYEELFSVNEVPNFLEARTSWMAEPDVTRFETVLGKRWLKYLLGV